MPLALAYTNYDVRIEFQSKVLRLPTDIISAHGKMHFYNLCNNCDTEVEVKKRYMISCLTFLKLQEVEVESKSKS